jgi:hypothetical protein
MFTILTPNEESFLRSCAETTQAKFVSGDMFRCWILKALATIDAERQARQDSSMTDTLFGPSVQSDAAISACGRYRYSLSRRWDDDPLKPLVGWIMLNPSTANHTVDDPTIRRCMGFAKAWGFAGITVRNLFALRATDPRELYKSDDPIGPENDKSIIEMMGECQSFVAAWGVHGAMLDRDKAVLKMFAERGKQVHCIGLTKDSFPKHPLYVAGNAELVPYMRAAK